MHYSFSKKKLKTFAIFVPNRYLVTDCLEEFAELVKYITFEHLLNSKPFS